MVSCQTTHPGLTPEDYVSSSASDMGLFLPIPEPHHRVILRLTIQNTRCIPPVVLAKHICFASNHRYEGRHHSHVRPCYLPGPGPVPKKALYCSGPRIGTPTEKGIFRETPNNPSDCKSPSLATTFPILNGFVYNDVTQALETLLYIYTLFPSLHTL